jgi:hypothetical protein
VFHISKQYKIKIEVYRKVLPFREGEFLIVFSLWDRKELEL